MSRLRGVAILAFFCAVADVPETSSDGIATDANIVTGLDMSESVDAAGMRIMIAGTARAISAPEVLSAIRS